MYEGAVQLCADCKHLVSDKIDFLSVTVPSFGQHLHGSLTDLVIYAIHVVGATGVGGEHIVDAVVDGTHGDSVLQDGCLRHSDVEVGIATHIERTGRGLDAFRGLECVAILPILIVGGDKSIRDVIRVRNTQSLVSDDRTSSQARKDTTPHIRAARTCAEGQREPHPKLEVLIEGVAQFRSALEVRAGSAAWRVAQDVDEVGACVGHGPASLALGLCGHHVASDGLAVHGQHVVERAVVVQAHGQRLQRHVVLLGEGQVLRHEAIDGFTQAVEADGFDLVGANERILYVHFAA